MKWDHTIVQRDEEVRRFAAEYLAKPGRSCLLICGAGFDPRTLALPRLLAPVPGLNLRVLCLREERPKPQLHLRPIADKHAAALTALFPGKCTTELVRIFNDNQDVVGGRNVVEILRAFVTKAEATEEVTDVLVDISALSCGIFFPIVALLLGLNKARKICWNIHLFVADNPVIDHRIRGEITDTVSPIHGFFSKQSLTQTSDHALLWVPVLEEGNAMLMGKIYDLFNQQQAALDISPVVAFPGINPRIPDILVEHYKDMIGQWEMDPRHFLFSAESDPLDSYRSICEIDELRANTYGALGGSSTVVSPLGSKMLSVGLMLAAIERDLRVLYVECLGYVELAVPLATQIRLEELPITHLWLDGEIYGGIP